MNDNQFDPVIKEVTVPGRAGKYYVREFDEEAADAYRQFRIDRNPDRDNVDPEKLNAALAITVSHKIMALAICDEAGALLLNSPAGLEKIKRMPAKLADPLFLAAAHLNLLMGAGDKEVRQAEEFFTRSPAKNSGPISPGTSGSPASAPANENSAPKGAATGSPT